MTLSNLYGYQEISHLSKQEQKKLIQKAKYEAYTTLGLAAKGISYLFLSALLAVITGQIILKSLPGIASLFGSIGVFLISYQLSTRSLIAQGLDSLMAKTSVPVKVEPAIKANS